MPETINNLIKFIKQHSVETWSDENGQIVAVGRYTYLDQTGNIQSTSKIETIEPTIKAVKQWLGY